MNKCIFFIVLIVSIGFASANDELVTKRIYPNISKNAIFDAAKTLFSLSNKENGNKDFIINSYRDKLKVDKVIFQYRILGVDLLLDKWLIEVHEFENESRVNLLVKRSDAIDLEDKKEVGISIHNLFWNRLDYLLGLTNNWKPCKSYFPTDLNSNNCYNFLLIDKPHDSEILKNILISQKNKNPNTIDNIKADILDKTGLYIKRNNNAIYEKEEDILNTNILTPIMEDAILETKAKKIIKKNIEEKENKLTGNSDKEEMQNSDKSIDEFKDNMKDIVNMKNSLNDNDIQKIIIESNDLKENSEFSLDSE